MHNHILIFMGGCFCGYFIYLILWDIPTKKIDYDIKLKNLKEIKKIQGYHGNWNYNNYMRGLYNGLELSLAIIEEKEPKYKDDIEHYLKKEQDNEKLF